MKERPILFSGSMVRAILEGRKTQTRRVIKPQPENESARQYKHFKQGTCTWVDNDGKIVKCPYGRPGHRLWVKETHYRYGKWLKNGKTPTGRQKWRFKPLTEELHYFDDPPDDVKGTSYRKEAWYKRPSIFMPRWASRINLEITAIRVERVKDITREDVLAEGLRPLGYGRVTEPQYCIKPFGDLWDTINAKRGYPWKDNPWIWVVEFKRVEA